ncbi:MAG: hypothetical protein AAFV96_14245, partial [Pseudomonadota bacterium]
QNQTSSTEIGVGIFNGGSAQDIDFGDFSDTGEYSVILTGLVVGEDPEEDAKRFRRTEGGIVLITSPMIDALTR